MVSHVSSWNSSARDDYELFPTTDDWWIAVSLEISHRVLMSQRQLLNHVNVVFSVGTPETARQNANTRLRSDRISFSWTKFRSESVLRLLTSWSAHTWLSVNCVGEWKKNIHQIALLLQYRNFDELRVYRQKRLYHWRKISISKLMLN